MNWLNRAKRVPPMPQMNHKTNSEPATKPAQTSSNRTSSAVIQATRKLATRLQWNTRTKGSQIFTVAAMIGSLILLLHFEGLRIEIGLHAVARGILAVDLVAAFVALDGLDRPAFALQLLLPGLHRLQLRNRHI